MEQSICIFYANVPIFAPLHLSPLIIANPIRYLPGYILSKMPSYTLYTQQTAIEREQNYSLLRIPTSPSYLLFGRIPLIIKQWNTMILIDIIVICNCLGGQYQGGGLEHWDQGTPMHHNLFPEPELELGVARWRPLKVMAELLPETYHNFRGYGLNVVWLELATDLRKVWSFTITE